MIFSHVLYQLSYPGSAAAAVPNSMNEGPASRWKRAYGEAALAWQVGINRLQAGLDRPVDRAVHSRRRTI